MKYFFFVAVLLSCLGSLLGQEAFQHSVGLSYLSVYSQQQQFTYPFDDRAPYDIEGPVYYLDFVAVQYYPRWNVKQWEQMAISVGTPLSISAFAEVSTADPIVQEKNNYLMLSLPVVAEGAWGYRSSRSAVASNVGVFVLGGGALTFGRGLVGEFSNVNPYLGGGVRIRLGERLGLELAYGQNFISPLEVAAEDISYGQIPPAFQDFGLGDLDAKDRRGTRMGQVSISFQ